jgi:hypothetical protein
MLASAPSLRQRTESARRLILTGCWPVDRPVPPVRGHSEWRRQLNRQVRAIVPCSLFGLGTVTSRIFWPSALQSEPPLTPTAALPPALARLFRDWHPARQCHECVSQLDAGRTPPLSLRAGPSSRLSHATVRFLGALFESLVTLDVRVYAQAAEARVGHLRTHRGAHEVDLIVARADQSVVAIEVKLASAVNDHDVRHLRWLREEIGDRLVDAVVITTGDYAYRRPDDGIAVIPAALLGP